MILTITKKILSVFALASMMITVARAAPIRNSLEHNLQSGLGLKGFDPVAVFPEGGGVPRRGDASIRLEYLGVTYYFSTAENRETFLRNPNRYEPTYGGWCAFAMASGRKVDIQTDLFTIHGNRVHYFVSLRAKQSFDSDIMDHEDRADGFWKQMSGEDPRY